MPALPIADKQTLDAVKALIGANTDPAGIATLFARMALLAGYVDELESRLTAARAAKLDAIHNWGDFRPQTAQIVNYTSTTYGTVINVTGRGVAFVQIYHNGAYTGNKTKITVDGTVLQEHTWSTASSGPYTYGIPPLNTGSGYIDNWATGSNSQHWLAWIGFKTSFLYQVAGGGGSASVTADAGVLLF